MTIHHGRSPLFVYILTNNKTKTLEKLRTFM
nr:MAG TPA: hypothetical protein [Bacteriophage sp.]